jgi:hypothetical protein
MTVALDPVDIPDEPLEDEGKTVSLQDAVNAANQAPEMNMGGMGSMGDEAKTVSFYEDSFGTEPVVGWLVCISGDYYGRSFELKSGRNFIGRSAMNDISLSSDVRVSRERHAIIIYEPVEKCFIAQAGESRELCYLNGKVVLSNSPMKAYDILTVGNEKLMFIPFCGSEFCWEDTIKESKS